jgi:hypothetical protein
MIIMNDPGRSLNTELTERTWIEAVIGKHLRRLFWFCRNPMNIQAASMYHGTISAVKEDHARQTDT